MDDPKWLRLITVGLILAAIAVGYLLFIGAFAGKTGKINGIVTTPMSTSIPSAYDKIAERTIQNTKTLPNTGFPTGLLGTISIGVVIVGWSLRKFPY